MSTKKLSPGGSTRLYRDLEVRAAVDALANTPETIDGMREHLTGRFGAARTPSRSALGRYVRLCRLARGIDFTRVV